MFFTNLFSANGSASWSRVGSFLALLAVIAWGSWVCWNEKKIPDLTGSTLFISALYGLGKINETIQNGQPK